MQLRLLAFSLAASACLFAQNQPAPTSPTHSGAAVSPAATPEELWSRASEAMVTLEGNKETGVGFLVVHKGAVCVVTTQDLLLRTRAQTVKTAGGKVLTVSKYYLADNGGVALGRFDKAPEGLKPLDSSAETPQLKAKDKLISAYPDKSIESILVKSVSSEVIEKEPDATPKASMPGHPVLNPRDGKVVAILAPVYSLVPLSSPTTAEGSNVIEMFKVPEQTRLQRWDKSEKWQEYNPGKARDEGLRVQRFQDHTRQLSVFLQQGAAYKELCEVTRTYQKYVDDISKTRLKLEYYEQQHSQFIGYFPVLAKRDLDVFTRDSAYFYAWNRQQAEEMIKARQVVVAKAQEMIKGLAGPFAKPSAR